MKYIKKIGMMVVAGFALAATSCSDYDDYNSVPVDRNFLAGKTMSQNIMENENLKDFAAIINKVNYGKVLDAAQCYTLWAPLDGTYDAAAVLAMDEDKIVNRFIKGHIAQYSYPVGDAADQRVMTLNEKFHKFGNGCFDSQTIADANIPAVNGLIHTINGLSEYCPSIYEFLDEVEGCDSFVKYIQKNDVYTIDRKHSVEGPIVNGQQTYLDTVLTKHNAVIQSLIRADIANEDSSFTLLFPTDEAWNKAYDRIRESYKYVFPLNYMDLAGQKSGVKASELKSDAANVKLGEYDVAAYSDSIPKLHIIRNLAFSNSFAQNAPLVTGQLGAHQGADTLYTTTKSYITNVDEVLAHCGEMRNMSNGGVRTIDSLCFKPWETFEKIHYYLTPHRTLFFKEKAGVTQNVVGKDTLLERHSDMLSEIPGFLKKLMFPTESRFFTYLSTDSVNLSGNYAPELDFALEGVLSTKYHIYVVIVPSQLKDPSRPISVDKTQNKDLYLRFDMAYTDAKGAVRYTRLNVPGAAQKDDIVLVNDGKMHVVELEFTFPICYAGLDAFPTLLMSNTKSFATSTNKRKFEREFRVAGIYLVPEAAYNHLQSLD